MQIENTPENRAKLIGVNIKDMDQNELRGYVFMSMDIFYADDDELFQEDWNVVMKEEKADD